MKTTRKIVSLNPDKEVNDPIQAAQLQMEIAIMRLERAQTALKRGYRHEFQESIKSAKQSIIRIHNLTQLSGPYDDKRLITALRESVNDGDTQVASDTSDGIVSINGNFNILKLARRLLW